MTRSLSVCGLGTAIVLALPAMTVMAQTQKQAPKIGEPPEAPLLPTAARIAARDLHRAALDVQHGRLVLEQNGALGLDAARICGGRERVARHVHVVVAQHRIDAVPRLESRDRSAQLLLAALSREEVSG